jgi:hypothetical protein
MSDLVQRLRALFRRPHRHQWDGSCWNRYCHDVEQTCNGCGARRHAPTFQHYSRDEWIDGPHPKAEELRLKECQ